jgi:hypothetical protein
MKSFRFPRRVTKFVFCFLVISVQRFYVTRDEAEADRVRHGRKHDRNLGRSVFCCQRCNRSSDCGYHIDALTNQFGRQRRQLLILAISTEIAEC